MPSFTVYLLAAAATLIPQIHAQYGGSNFFMCYDTQLPNGTYTTPRCCVSYDQSTDGLYTGYNCTGASVSEDSSIVYCANGNPIPPEIDGAVNPGCCGWVSEASFYFSLSIEKLANSAQYAGTTSHLCVPKPVAVTTVSEARKKRRFH